MRGTAIVLVLMMLGAGCATPAQPQMIPAERIAREPVPGAYVDVPLPPGDWRAECYLLYNSAQTYRAVQLAGIGLTTIGIVGALLSKDSEFLQTASTVATAAGTVTQLAAGTVAEVKEYQAAERGCAGTPIR